MKTKFPYSFPLKSRKAMVDYLTCHESYGGWNHPYRRWSPLSWNVKIGHTSNDGKRGEYKVNPEFDEAWQEHVASDHSLSDMIVEDMQRTYTEKEYSTYSGEDQGHWEFCFAGRSGGHMMLTKWEDLDFLKNFSNSDDWQQWLDGIMFSALQTLYRAVACMDQDFTRDKIAREFEHQLNFQRNQWEEEHASQLAFAGADNGLEPCPSI